MSSNVLGYEIREFIDVQGIYTPPHSLNTKHLTNSYYKTANLFNRVFFTVVIIMCLSYRTLEICILSTLPLLVILTSLGSDMRVVIGYVNMDSALSYLNDERILIIYIAYQISLKVTHLNIRQKSMLIRFFQMNHLNNFYHQIFPNESLKNEVIGNTSSLELQCLLNYNLFWVLTFQLRILK